MSIINAAYDALDALEFGKAVAHGGLPLDAIAEGKLAEYLSQPDVSTVSFPVSQLLAIAEDLSLMQGGTTNTKVRRVLFGGAGQPALLHTSEKKAPNHTDRILYEPVSLATWQGGSVYLFKGGLHRFTGMVAVLAQVADTKGIDLDTLMEDTIIPVSVYRYETEAQARMSAITDNGSRSTTSAEKAAVKTQSLYGIDTNDIDAVAQAMRDGTMTPENGIYFLMGNVQSGNEESISDNTMLQMVSSVVKKALNLTVTPCKYGVAQDGSIIRLNEHAAVKVPLYRLATLGGETVLSMPESDVDAYVQEFLPETDQDGIPLFSVAEYNEDNGKLTVTVEGDLDWFAQVLTDTFRKVAKSFKGNIARDHKSAIVKDVLFHLNNTPPQRAYATVLPVSNYKPTVKRVTKKAS